MAHTGGSPAGFSPPPAGRDGLVEQASTPIRPTRPVAPRLRAGVPLRPFMVKAPFKRFACQFCSEVQGSLARSRWHASRIHRDREFAIICRFCAAKFPNIKEYSEHSLGCSSPRRVRAPIGVPAGSGLSTPVTQVKPPMSGSKRRLSAVWSPPVLGNWTSNELQRLESESARLRGDPRAVRKLSASFPGKTQREITDARRHLRSQTKGRSSNVAPPVPDPSILALRLLSPIPTPTVGAARALKKAAFKSVRGGVKRGCQLAKALRDVCAQIRHTGKVVEAATSLALAEMGAWEKPKTRRKPTMKLLVTNNPGLGMSHYKKRGQLWREAALLMKKNPKRLANLLIDGTRHEKCPIPVAEMEELYRERWSETHGSFRGLGGFKAYCPAENGSFHVPFKPEEVSNHLAAMKESAAGPEGLTKSKLRAWSPDGSRLATLFNLWLVSGIVPKMVKAARTTLIPKSNDPGKKLDPGNWRPITIGSFLLRLFSRLVHSRLREACPINPRQRGFIDTPGCSENLCILLGLIRHANTEKRPLAVVFIDVAKAFDTVSHKHLLEVLEQRQLDEHVIKCVKATYQESTSYVAVKEGVTSPIPIERGVKQGDPLSPLMFNLALDPLVCALEKLGKGASLGELSVTVLAFADDLVLLSDTWVNMTANLEILTSFCDLTGLRINAQKCFGFHLDKPHGDQRLRMCLNTAEPWTISGEAVAWVESKATAKYLGVCISPFKGIVVAGVAAKLSRWLAAVGRAPLCSKDKIHLWRLYVQTRLTYALDHGGVGVTQLKALDRQIRVEVRKWLQLHHTACSNLFYVRCKDGGLGLKRLARMIPTVQAKRVHRLLQSEDVVTRAAAWELYGLEGFKRFWIAAGGHLLELPRIPAPGDHTVPTGSPPGANEPELPGDQLVVGEVPWYNPTDMNRDEFLNWLSKPVQGVGLEGFYDSPESNLVFTSQRIFKNSAFNRAVQLRANVYPTREFAARGSEGLLPTTCRACRARVESSSHILGMCPAVRQRRIRRHNWVRDAVGRAATGAGWRVVKEKSIQLETGRVLCPDLILVKGDEAWVVDVTVRFELKTDSLKQAAREKAKKYSVILPIIMRDFRVSTARAVGFPLGARGQWFRGNGRFLALLGLSKRRTKTLAKRWCKVVLRRSLSMMKAFYGRRSRRAR